MGIQIDQVSLTVKGNVVKKFDGTTSLLRFGGNQLEELRESIDQALVLLNAHPANFNDGVGETSESVKSVSASSSA